MRNVILRLLLPTLLVLSLTACGEKSSGPDSAVSQPVTGTVSGSTESQDNSASTLTVRFGDRGNAFSLYLEDNPVLEGWGNKIVRISAGERNL